MRNLLVMLLIAWCSALMAADSLKVIWGMTDRDSAEFTAEKLLNVTFKARITNYGSGYNSAEATEVSPGNSIQLYNDIRGECVIDFSNFTDWTWRSGDMLSLVVKDGNPDAKGYWYEAVTVWTIPETVDGICEFGFEDLGVTGSGLPLSTWSRIVLPEKKIHLGIVDNAGAVFDFTSEPFNNVTFECMLNGNADDIITQDSASSTYEAYDSTASAVVFDLYDLQSSFSPGDTVNINIKHDSDGLGYYTGTFDYILEDTSEEYIYLGLDSYFGEGNGGGEPLIIADRTDESMSVIWGMKDRYGGEFTADDLEYFEFRAWIENSGNSYKSDYTTNYDPGNSIKMISYRAVCEIDFNNFNGWNHKEGDVFYLFIYYRENDMEIWYNTEVTWNIPEDYLGQNLFGLSPLNQASGEAIYTWYTSSLLNNTYIGAVDQNGNNFDFTGESNDNVTFECWISGREDDILDEQSTYSDYYYYYDPDMSAIKIEGNGFPIKWFTGDTLNVKIVQHFPGSGYYTGESKFVFDTVFYYPYGPNEIRFGLDSVYGEGYGGGDPVKVDVWTDDTGIEGPVHLPEVTALYQNYPNPFNPVTQIRFDLSKAGNVKLSVYNVNGQKVTELANGTMNAGNHSVDLDASELNSGLYYYTLEAEERNLTKKMLLIK